MNNLAAREGIPGEPINLALRDHQSGAEAWDNHAPAAALHHWAERMILEFKLQIGMPVLRIEPLRRRYGSFRPGRNGFGLVDEIGLDEMHVRQGPCWNVCGTLLQELLRSWQEHHGRSGRRHYCNRQYRAKAFSLGLVIDAQGITQYLPGDTPFFSLLRKYGIAVPDHPEPQMPGPARTGSKLKLFACGCGVKIRVGRSHLNARCLDCGSLFVLQEKRPAFVGNLRAEVANQD